MTNFEKIKNMSVRQMAEMLFDSSNKYNYCYYCTHRGERPYCTAVFLKTGCINAITKWLNLESETEGNKGR